MRALLVALAIGCGSGETADESTEVADARIDAQLDAIQAMDSFEEIAADSGSDAAVEATADAGDAGSRCKVTETTVFCEHNVTAFAASDTVRRDVYWQTPLTPAPPRGYPVVILYQGSFAAPAVTWATLNKGTPFGGFHQGLLQARLLDSGFTVIAPTAAGGAAWQTNAAAPWSTSTDHVLVQALLAAIAKGAYGPADTKRLYATGISSGGYMTSRMAVSYPGVFRTLAIAAGSYATCLGAICNIPGMLPSDHPPTLFLHGGADATVPIATMRPYHDKLKAQGVEVDLEVDPAAGHEWLATSPKRIVDWFRAHE